jgi:hypothetical protein
MGIIKRQISTKDLFENIKSSLHKEESLFDKYKASDLLACVYADIADARRIVEENKIANLYDIVGKKEQYLEKALKSHDIKVVSSCLDELISTIAELPQKEVIEQANYDEAYERHRVEETTVVLGDSHVNFFSGNEALTFFSIGQDINVSPQVNGFPFTALHLGACLAYKSNMYGSSEGFLEKLDWLMEHFIIPGGKVVVSLGEIDIRCHVFEQTVKQGCAYERIVDGILENYFDMLLYVKEHGFETYIWGPIASQIEKCPIGDYLPKVGGEVERNMATRYFTEKAKERCKEIGIGFSSIFEEMITDDMRTKESFISEDMCHLTQSIYDIAVKEWERAGILR